MEKITSKHKTLFVARKIAKLMIHSITQLADSATNLLSPKDERKELKSEQGQGRKTSTLDANTNHLDPSIILANLEQKRYYENWHFGGISERKTHVQKGPEEEERDSTQHVSYDIVTCTWPPSSPSMQIVLKRNSIILVQSSFRSSHRFESPQTSPWLDTRLCPPLVASLRSELS